MKIEIRLDKSVRIRSCSIHDINSLPHRREVLIRGANRSQCRDLRLQNFPHFYQIGPSVWFAALDNSVQRTAHGIRGSIRDESSAAGKGVDQTFLLKRFDRFAISRPADTELLGKIALRRKLGTFT